MIKSVALALPVYFMFCFKLPKGICNEVTKQVASYWWGQKENERKIHWVAWNKMATPKEKGGMGMKNLQAFNEAFLAKQVWRLITHPNILMRKMMKARYYPKSSILRAKVRAKDSWIWRNCGGARKLIQEGSRWNIGDGTIVKVWDDNWLPA